MAVNKIRLNYLIALLLAVFVSSCKTWIAAPFTSPAKMAELKPGMSMDNVNSTLGVKPYNVNHLDGEEGKLLM